MFKQHLEQIAEFLGLIFKWLVNFYNKFNRCLVLKVTDIILHHVVFKMWKNFCDIFNNMYML